MQSMCVLSSCKWHVISMFAFCAQDMAASSSRVRIGVVGYGHLGLTFTSQTPSHTYESISTSNYLISDLKVSNVTKVWPSNPDLLYFLCAAGQYLVERILRDGATLGLTLVFVWNRNSDKLKGSVPDELILGDLSSFAERCKPTDSVNRVNLISRLHNIIFKLMIHCFGFRQCDVIVEVCHPHIVKEFGLLFLSQAHFMVRSSSVCIRVFYWHCFYPVASEMLSSGEWVQQFQSSDSHLQSLTKPLYWRTPNPGLQSLSKNSLWLYLCV